MGFENCLHVGGDHHGQAIGQRLKFVAMKNVCVFLIGICAMQSFAETKFFAKRSGVGFGGQEGIGAAFDDELTIVKSDAVGGDLAAPAIGRLINVTSCWEFLVA